jgi:phospholipid/cholesterol/gamma-HCH transport system substrate-binding protein
VGKLLSDDTVYDDAAIVMANLRNVTDRIAAGEGTVGKLLMEDAAVYDNLDATMVAVRGITESINSGEGTLGKLVRDAKLYDEATLLVEDVRAAIDDLREASPITSFGSVMFGAF